jgi:hypothetical protein
MKYPRRTGAAYNNEFWLTKEEVKSLGCEGGEVVFGYKPDSCIWIFHSYGWTPESGIDDPYSLICATRPQDEVTRAVFAHSARTFKKVVFLTPTNETVNLIEQAFNELDPVEQSTHTGQNLERLIQAIKDTVPNEPLVVEL